MLDKQYLLQSFDFSGSSLDLLGYFSDQPHVFFLDSSQYDPHRGRYSFIGFDPFDTFVHKGEDTLDQLKGHFTRYGGERSEGYCSMETPLTSGIVGCLSYDYGLRQEEIAVQSASEQELPDCFFGFYDCILTIDHFSQKLYLSSSGLPETNALLREKRARQRMSDMTKRVKGYFSQADTHKFDALNLSRTSSLNIKCNFSKDQYLNAVKKALDHISAGNIYQVNLSQRFVIGLKGKEFDPIQLYRDLRNISPSPFGGYIDCGKFQLISNSPERFLHLNRGVVQSRPMKGTRPRGINECEDRQLRHEILNSAKEKAELMMITDLVRNDLGRVCNYGSINVKEMRTIEEYKYVFQATSTVEGMLNNDKDCFDLIRACFPGGSVTGCPKIRAMEVIEELEPTGRGMYTGSMGYINFSGNMDLNILIRTCVCSHDQLVFQVGGGIVADSIPENEYNETLVKARAIRDCLGRSLSDNKQILECNARVLS